MDEGAEGDATLPRGRQVRDGHIPVALRLLLAPGEQPRRSDLGLCDQTAGLKVCEIPEITPERAPAHGTQVNRLMKRDDGSRGM